MAPRMKVFTWSDGFHRYTVAASSRAKALEIWGFHRDLFKTGDAQQITSGEDHDRALANPGISVERGLEVDPGKVALKRAPPKTKAPSKRDQERVARLQADLEALTRDHGAAMADLDRRRTALEAEAEHADSDFNRRRAALDKALEAARRRLSN